MAESSTPLGSAPPGAGAAGARLQAYRSRLARELWHDDPRESVLLRGLRSLAQLVALTIQGFRTDKLLLRASALTYVTALSVIPLLGVAFAFLRLFGGDAALLDYLIQQLTTVAPEAEQQVRSYVDNLNFARFGTIGGALVFGTAVLALRHLETTLNDIWAVPDTRGWARRFSDYLAVMIVGPLSTGIAVSLATTLQSGPVVARLLENAFFARVYGLGLAQVPLLVLWLGFTFLYWFFPNTGVRVRSAALGGLVAAVLFLAARTIYVDFQVGAATYQAVFGALAAVPLILAWLYTCWAILLLGAEVAFAAQNLGFARREMRAGEASPAQRETIAVELTAAVGRAFRAGEPPPSAARLADWLDEPVRTVRRLLGELEEARIVRSVVSPEGADAGFVPAAPLAQLTVGAVLRAIRGEAPAPARGAEGSEPGVRDALSRIEGAWTEEADRTRVAELIDASPDAAPDAAPDDPV